MADPKPKFDPNKPFTENEGQKPKFDPTADFEEVKKKVGTSTSTIPKENTELAPTTGSSASKGTNGFPKIDTNGIAPNYEEMKPAVENPVGKEKRLRKELANVKVTPENMDEISAMTDTLSATIKANQKAKDQAKSQRVKELETSFYDATRNNDDDAVAEQRLTDAVQVNGVWNNVKSIAKKSYNTLVDAVSATSPTLIGLQSAKVNTDPLADEKKQAKQEAAKNKQTLSETEINQRAQEIFKAKEKDNLFIDRANSFLDNMDDKDKELLKQDRANKAEHLQEDNLKRLKVVSAMRTVAQDKIDDYKEIESQLEKLKESGQPFPEDLYNQYNALGSEIKNLGAELQKNEDYILNNKKDLGTAQQELDLFKREYGDLYNFGQNVAISAEELAVNTLAGLDYVATLGGNLDPGNKNKGVQEDLQKADNYFKETRGRLRKPVESVESVEGFVNYASDLMANQIPNLVATSTGAKGLGLIGTASAGKKFTDMNEEVRQGKASYSPLEMAVAPLLYGSAEVISEIPTLSILKKGGRVIESIARNEGELITKTVKQKAVEIAKDYGVDMSKEMAGEQFTNFAQNFNDKYVLGKKDVNLLDNTGQVFKDTFTLTSILKAAPHTFGVISKPFQSKTDLGTLDENSRKIIEFSKQLNAEGLTDTEKSVIQKQIDKATAESSKIVANTIGKISDMPGELYDEVVALNSKAGEIKAQAREINDGNLSNKTELLKGLGEDYKALQDKRNGIIEGSVSVVDVLPLKEQETLKKQAMEDLVTELNPDGKKNITITNEQVVERANEIYAESKANTASTEPKIATTEPTPVVSEESNKTQTSPPSSSEVATPSVNPTIEGNSPLSVSASQENSSEAEGNLPLKSKLSDEEKAKVQKKVVSKPRVILRSGKVGTDAFFALPNEGVFGDVVDKVGSDENVTAYRYPKDFKIKDLSNDVVFDEYMSKKMFEDTKKEGYDAAYVMEIDGSKVLHVINPEKLTLLDEKLPELRNNEATPPTNTPADGNIRLGTEPMGKNGATKQESPVQESVSSSVDGGANKREVSVVFKDNKELQDIGSEEQYLEHLKNIFPDSKIKKTVYHGGSLNKNDKIKKTNFFNHFFFTSSKDYATSYSKDKSGEVQTAILNIKNLVNARTLLEAEGIEVTSANLLKVTNSNDVVKELMSEGYDGVYAEDADENTKELNFDEYVVFDPEQIHILGSKKDVEMFRLHVSKSNKVDGGDIRTGTGEMVEIRTTEQESTAEESVPKPNNVPTAKGEVTAKLQQINKKVFGLDDKKSKANTVVMKKTLETIAERTGKTKEEVFDSIHFEKGDAATAEKLSKKGKALFQIIGQNAKLSEQTKGFLEDAKTLEKQGAEAKTIFLQTGWEKGADGKWKYDMQEGTVEFKKTENGNLEDVLDYPELFDKYPEAKGIKIVFNGKMDMEGMFDASKNRIFINPSTGIKEAKVSLLHEIQHWVQKKEGFSKGGSTETAKAAIAEKINTEKNPSIKKALNGLKNLLFAKKVNAEKVNSELTRLEKLISKDDFELYQSIAGEVEARNVEKRYEMTDNERRNTSLSETEDVGRDEQVVLFQGEQGAMLAKDGEFIIYALTDPNVSTPLHEMAHVYEHYLTEAERNTLLKEAGHTTWSRETSEHFARGFEKYLADGIAPSPEMKTIFDNFKKWLTEIYKGIQDSAIDIRLSPEMKAVYNEMLGEKSKKETTDKPIQYKASENGKPYNVVFENGELKITDENGKAPSAPTRRAIEEKHAENFDFTKGETALDKQKINDVSTWEEDVAAHSENPVEVAETLLRTYTMDASEGLDTQSKHIAEAIGGKGVERSSFVQRVGKKGMKDIPGSLAMQYFAPKGKGSGLDIIAQNAEIAMYGDWDSQNPRITEDDVFDFINDNPRGTVDYLNSAKKEKINALKTAFTHLTGLPANEKYLGKAIEQGAEKDFRLKNEEVLYQYSDEDLVSLSNEFDQFTKVENGKSEKTSEVNGNGTPILDKQNQKASEGEFGIQETRGRTTGTESQGKPEEVTPEGGITNDGELANEHNRTKSLVSERVAYEKVTPKNPPKKLSEIIKQVSTALKTTLIYGKSKRGGAGSYNPTNALVRISRAGDIDTVAHELGHLLDDRHDILGTIPSNDKAKIDEQLKWYSERGGSNPPAKATPAQKADYLQREGLAEFIRSLIANPTQTKIVAPELLQHFETVVDQKTQAILKDFSQDFLDFANASNIEKTLANVEDLKLPNKNKFIEWLKGFRSNDSGLSFTNMDKFYSEMANSNHFGIKAFKALLDMSGKSDIKSHENFEIMSRVFLGINGKLENIFGSGLINAKNEKLKAEGGVFKKDANGRTVYEDGTPMTAKWLIDGLDTTSEETLNKEMNEVVAMAIAERTIEYAKKFGRVTDLTGIGGSVDTDLSVAIGALNEFEDLKKSNPEKYNRIKDGVERYRKMADAPLRYAVDKGRISEEQYKLIKDSNEYYVALNRNIELVPGEDMFVAFGGSSNAIGSAKEIIKKSKGGTETIENPYLSLLANINNIIKESDRNEVMSSFVEPLLNMRTMGDGTPIDFSQIGRLANEGDKNTISVYRDGKLEKWQFEENIYKGLKNIESISSDPILSLFAKPSQLIRWTVTHNPVFYARNIVKDTQARMIVSNDHSSFNDMIHNSSDRELFELYGGSQAGHLHTGKDSYSKAMVTAAKEITAKGGMIINPMNWGKKYVKFLQSGENINRIAEFNNSYKKAKAQGMSDYDAGLYAAFQARDLMDFAVAGHTMRKINQIVVFSNAGVQSIRKAGKSLQRDPYGFAYRTGLYSVLPTIAFSALRAVMGDDDDDEEYEQLPDNQRDLFFNFKLPLLFGDAWVSIPKPYELGLTSSLVDRGISKIRGNDSALDGFMGTTIKTIMPFDESSFLGGLKPIVETAMNRNTYTGAPIVSEHESGKLLELRKGKSKSSLVGQDVSLLFKQAGLSVDPRNIDHIMKGYGTYFASQGMAITDLGKKEKTPLNFWIKQSGFAKDVASYNAKSVKKASDLAVEIGKINSGEMKDLRNKIEEFALETDLKKRKELTKTIYTDAKDIVKKYSAEKENAILYREKQLELEANLDAIADKVPARELRDNPEYIKAKKALTDYNESIKKPSN